MKKDIDGFIIKYKTLIEGVEVAVSLQWVGDSSDKEEALNTVKKYLGDSDGVTSTQNYLH